VDLWNFRWEHAQGAHRRPAAAIHRKRRSTWAAAKAILDKGGNSEQAPFFSLFARLCRLLCGRLQSALEEFLKANQNDPFIQCLTAQAYEKTGR